MIAFLRLLRFEAEVESGSIIRGSRSLSCLVRPESRESAL